MLPNCRSLLYIWILCSVGAISSTTGEKVDPRLICIAHFLDDVVTEMSEEMCSDMAANISDLTMQVSVLYEEMVKLNESITERVHEVCRMDESQCIDLDKQNTSDTVTLPHHYEVAKTVANHTSHIIQHETNLSMSLQTSTEQSNIMHQMQQNMEIMQERLDAVNHTLLQTDGDNQPGSEDLPQGKSS